ncbi:hypothetical protein [Paenibacillus glycanilyticus]|uniref:hypothetical protein n=1 Tax=Paenibacillus glycanilyticus TaxID=126569 RepID=UPI003EB937AD
MKEGLVRGKLLELLFDVADADEQFFYQFLQLKRRVRKGITEIMELNVTNPVSRKDLAYLSGRSLSTFKRDFQAIHYTSPLRWIRNRRLDIERDMLLHTFASVTDICFSVSISRAAAPIVTFKKTKFFSGPKIPQIFFVPNPSPITEIGYFTANKHRFKK